MNKNELPGDSAERRIMVTLESSPNGYIQHPAYGEVYVDEFDIHGNPLLVSFRQYQHDGTLGVKVRLGRARDCEWRNGFRDGARVAIRTHYPTTFPSWAAGGKHA